MSDDPYTVLGVKKTASQEDIRKAYRDLAKKLHPDLNPGDKAAEERFKKVATAYDIVGDPDKRGQFDRGEIDASGAERPDQQFYRNNADADGSGRYHRSAGFEDLGDVSDIFADLFGRRGSQTSGARGTIRMRGQDVQYHLEVDFLDAAKGAKRRIAMPDAKALDIAIPAGTRDGGILRLKGKGGSGLGGGPAGDAFIEIAVRPHPVFRREGNDILIELPITLDEAVLGGKVEVATLSGRVNLTVPKGSSSGDVLRLKGKGIAPPGGTAGDQRVVLKVVMPKEIDGELAEFVKTWRQTHAYNPRAGKAGSA